MDEQQRPRTFSRNENAWASPRPSPPRSPLPLKSPVSSSSPWASNSSNPNIPRVQRKSSFEDGVDARPSSPIVVNGELPEEQVFVTHVESPVLFWAQSAEHETAQVIEKMTNDLQIYCRNKPLLQSTPHIGKVYGGVYTEDKQWYRCRVKKLIEEDKVEVHFVDYGNTEEISLRTIVFLSHEILSLVPFAQLYCLDGVTVTNSELVDQGSNALHDLTTGKILSVRLKETKKALDVACPVELRDDSDGGVGNIADKMIRQGLLTATEQDGPPPLSPRTSLSDAMVKEMEELRKDNDTLRSMIKVYQDNEKAVDEIRKFYSAQAAKQKEKMEQAVNYKVLQLVSKVNDLKQLRDTAPVHGKTSEVIREAIALNRDKWINLDLLRSLQQVKENEGKLQEAQKCLCDCSDKEMMPDLILKRDQARQELFDTIGLFCKEVDFMPLQDREQSLQLSLGQLQEQTDTLNSCNADSVLEEAVEAYEDWLEKSQQDVSEIRKKVNVCTDTIITALANLQLALRMSSDSSDAVVKHLAFGDLDAMIAELSAAAQEEIDKTKVSEDKEAKQIADLAMASLAAEHKREIADIHELRDHLVAKYKDLQADMVPWLNSKPDVKKMGEVRKSVKSLRSKLRHRLADKKDLEEGDELENPEELQKVESDISEIYLQLHECFEEESECLADLAKFTSDHFPELPIVHPELGISDYLDTNGLAKPGRELEHYPHHDSIPYMSHDKCSVINTEYAGTPCILKELSLDRDLGDNGTLQNRAVNFSRVNNSCLVQLQAFFVKGNRAFIQMPRLTKFEEWLASSENSSKDVCRVLRDVLGGLRALHANNICHGCVNLQSVLVEKVDEQYRGRLDFNPFTTPQCNRAQDMTSFENLVAKINILNRDHMISLAELAEELQRHE